MLQAVGVAGVFRASCVREYVASAAVLCVDHAVKVAEMRLDVVEPFVIVLLRVGVRIVLGHVLKQLEIIVYGYQ